MFKNDNEGIPQLPKQLDMEINLLVSLLTSLIAIYHRPFAATRAGSSKEQRVMGTPETLSGEQPTLIGSEVFTFRDLNDVKIDVMPGRSFHEVVRLAASLNQIILLVNFIRGRSRHGVASIRVDATILLTCNRLGAGNIMSVVNVNKTAIHHDETHALRLRNMNITKSDHHSLTV
jgi:hypothetical protein